MTEAQSPYRTRALLLACLFFLSLLAITVRLGWLQMVRRDEYRRIAERQHAKTVSLKARRGTIVDRHGETLAVSTAVDSIYGVPGQVGDPSETARALAPLLEEPVNELERKLSAERGFVWIKRKVPPAVAQAVKRLKLAGIGFLPEHQRYYPNRELAAHLIGFEGLDERGLDGLELGYDRFLSGEPGLALVERDALGRGVTVQRAGGDERRIFKPSTPGYSLVLTIDATIQYMVEKELDLVWRQTRAKGGMALAMDPKTGELLALALRPTFNPNNLGDSAPTVFRNRALTDVFEPGSTFKIVLAAAVLDEELIRPGDRFFAENGAITVHDRVIHDWKKYGWLTFQQVLQMSSNVGAIKVGMLLGKERYYRYITKFGFGEPTGLGLPGESRGILRTPKAWSGVSLASISIGQEVSVTALQLLAAVAAIGNQGRLMRPQVVREIRDAEGRVARRFEPTVVRQVISEQTAKTLVEILKSVVREGTGKNAAIEGYEVAGKTGTAQKLDPRTHLYSRDPGILSFVGFVPADDPRLAMLILLDEPKGISWGSEVAAPVFARTGKQILAYLGIPLMDSPPVQIVHQKEDGPGAVATIPTPAIEETPRVMPNLVGKSLRQALTALAPYDVQLVVQGQGVVVRQRPVPGTPLGAGDETRLELVPPVVARR